MSEPASRRDHQRFCQVEGWIEVRNARGKKTQHHITYELALSDGSVLRTRISRPANKQAYGPSLWRHILDDQLQVTEEVFWKCVNERIKPSREHDDVTVPASALPADLAYQLVNTLNLSADEIAGMTVEDAVQRLAEHWTKSSE